MKRVVINLLLYGKVNKLDVSLDDFYNRAAELNRVERGAEKMRASRIVQVQCQKLIQFMDSQGRRRASHKSDESLRLQFRSGREIVDSFQNPFVSVLG